MITKNLFTAVLLAASLASASSACYESKSIEDAGFVKVVDADGKKHKFAVFVLGEEDQEEFGVWMKGRKTAALAPDMTLYLKTAAGVDTIPNVPRCPASKRAALKM
jgi:hypothetical protein